MFDSESERSPHPSLSLSDISCNMSDKPALPASPHLHPEKGFTMPSIYDEAFDFNTAAEQASSDRTAEARQRYTKALGAVVSSIKRDATYAGKRAELTGGDEADVFDAMASVLESGINPPQAAVTGNGTQTQAQAVSSPDVIDSQVAGLEQDLRHAKEDSSRLQEDYRRLNEENGRLVASARRASDYLAQLDEANRQLLAANEEKVRLERQVTNLTADRAEAYRKRDEALDQLAEARRNAPQAPQPAPASQPAPQPAPAPQPSGRQSGAPRDNRPAQSQADRPQRQQRPANSPSATPEQQPRQGQPAPAAPPEQSAAGPAPTTAMPAAQPQAQQGKQRGWLNRIVPGHGHNN